MTPIINTISTQKNSSTDSYIDFQFNDLFELEKIQHLQDLFANTHEVASVITLPDGTPLTKPSKFTRLCASIIRDTEKGCANCCKSDAIIDRPQTDGPIVQPCLSGGLWDAGVSITVGGKHVASWMIGQVKNDKTDISSMLKYADEIGAERETFLEALNEVPVMSTDKFRKIAELLFVFVNEMSERAFANFQLKKESLEKERAFGLLTETEEKYRLIAENTTDLLAILDLDLNYTYLSPSSFSLLGYTPEELKTHGFGVAITPESREMVVQILKEEMSTERNGSADPQRSRNIITEQIRKDGRKIWIESSVSFVRDSTGLPTNIITISKDITERRLIEDSLRESEEKFRNIFDHSPIGISITTLSGKMSPNEAFCQILGYTKDELALLEWQYITHVDCIENDQCHFNSILSGEKISAQWEKRYIHKNGSAVWANISTTLQRDNAGIPLYFITSINDITERKNAEIALIDNEKRWRQAVAASPIPIMIHDEDGRVLQLSTGWTKYSGYTIDDIPTISNWTDRAYGEQSETVRNYINALFTMTETKRKDGWMITTKNGSTRIWNFQSTPLGKSFNGKRVVHSLAIDVTEQKAAEDKLRESEQFLKDAQTIANLGTYFLDVNTGFWKSSEILDKIFGIGTDYERSVEGWLNLTHPDWKAIMLDYLTNEVLGKRMDFNKEYQIIRQNDKAVRWIHGRGNLKVNNNNEIVSMLGTIQDITEQKEAEILLKIKNEELVVAKGKAEESDRLKSSFLANMSHEVRTPLNSIIGFSELLNDPDFEWEIKEEFIQTIIEQGNNLLSIISDIMDLSMLDSNQIALRKERFAVSSVINDLYNNYNKRIQNKGIEFRLNIPDYCKNIVIESDIYRVNQILSNLISNALKFTSKGFIEFGYTLKNNLIEFYIKDTGIGIPSEFQQLIFERFVQVESSNTRKYGGNGLGLTISKKLAEILGGSIRLESETHIGSTFYFAITAIQLDVPEKSK